MKNAKAAPHNIDASTSKHKDDDDDAADDDVGLAASQAATKVDLWDPAINRQQRFSHARNVQLGLEESGCCPDYMPNLLGKSF